MRTGALLILALAGLLASPAGAVEEELPDGVQQIIPRGSIPAIFEPTFVSASDADIPREAWILGVHVEGEARAYSLNLLNHHEIVNDRAGGVAFAAVW